MQGKEEVQRRVAAGALWTRQLACDPLSPRKPMQTCPIPVPDLRKTCTRGRGCGFCTGRVQVSPRIPAGLPVVFPSRDRTLWSGHEYVIIGTEVTAPMDSIFPMTLNGRIQAPDVYSTCSIHSFSFSPSERSPLRNISTSRLDFDHILDGIE